MLLNGYRISKKCFGSYFQNSLLLQSSNHRSGYVKLLNDQTVRLIRRLHQLPQKPFSCHLMLHGKFMAFLLRIVL